MLKYRGILAAVGGMLVLVVVTIATSVYSYNLGWVNAIYGVRQAEATIDTALLSNIFDLVAKYESKLTAEDRSQMRILIESRIRALELSFLPEFKRRNVDAATIEKANEQMAKLHALLDKFSDDKKQS
jgi:phosphoserine aminotransferase